MTVLLAGPRVVGVVSWGKKEKGGKAMAKVKGATRITVKTINDPPFEFRLMLVPCGRRECHKCPHGPYWYARYWIGRRSKEVYIGRHLVDWKAGKNRELFERLQKLAEREELDSEGVTSDGRKG